MTTQLSGPGSGVARLSDSGRRVEEEGQQVGVGMGSLELGICVSEGIWGPTSGKQTELRSRPVERSGPEGSVYRDQGAREP